jgi:stage III sporulation protein AF
MITNWVREAFLMILSITFLEILLPEGTLKNYVKFIYSLIIMAVLLGPLQNLMHR